PGETRDRIIPEIIVRALRRQELKMTQGHQTREFNFVEDIAKGFVLAATAPADVEGQILNLGCGEEVSMRHVAQTILDLMGNPIEPQFGALPSGPPRSTACSPTAPRPVPPSAIRRATPSPKGWRRPSPGRASSSPTRDRRSSRHRAASRALICEEPSAVRIANGEVGPEDPDHGTVAGCGLVDGLHDARPRRGVVIPDHD